MDANTLETNKIFVLHRPSYPRLGVGYVKTLSDGIITAAFWVGYWATESGSIDDFEIVEVPDTTVQVSSWIDGT